ncbi:unnamed protein product [Effrenium voratum]|nr:unnamed protein product [Effrenium voratum]
MSCALGPRLFQLHATLRFRQAVADLLKVTLAEVKAKRSQGVRVVSGTSRRLSVVMKLQVEVSAAASEIALLSSSAGQEMLHTELLESWDTRGLQDLSVVIGAVEDAEVTTSEQPEAAVRAESPTQAILLVVVCSFACSAVAGVLYCWRWRTSAVSPAAESPKGDAESPKGVALPSLRAAATASEGSMKSVVKEAPAMSVQVRVAASAEENSAPSTPAAPRKTTLPAKAVRTHSVRAVSVTRKSSQASASRSPLSHAPRPGSPSVFEMSPAPRLPLEPLGGGSDLTPCKRPPGSPSPKKT